MLKLTIQGGDMFDQSKEEFISVKGQTIALEHSLVSLSKWESKWKKPFFSDSDKTMEETIDYVRCMTLTQNVDPNLYLFLNDDHMTQIAEYIKDPMTATWFSDNTKQHHSSKKETTTSELIYYFMIACNIPMECQKWHLNRLFTLIRICEIKNNPKSKKMSRRDIMNQNRELNAMRRAQTGGHG